MSDKVEVPAWLLEKLFKDPKYIEKAQRAVEFDSFKTKYAVTNASGLRCPGCLESNQFGGGSLWWNPDYPTRFVCRKCRLVWTITCETTNLEDVIKQIKGK